MSSQESTTIIKRHSSSISRSSGKLKRRRHRHREPDRLGWLGGDHRPSSAPAASQGSLGQDDCHVSSGSQDSSLLTPRPLEDFPAGGEVRVKSNGGEAVVDLTDDSEKLIGESSKKNDWECTQCTLINPINETVCQVCGFRRGSTRKKTSQSSQNSLLLGESHCENDVRERNHAIKQKNGKNIKQPKQQPTTTKPASRPTEKISKESSQLWKWTQSQSSTKSQPTKKPKRSITKPTSADPSTELWIDKHTPQTSNELCIAPKKIEEVRKWLSSHISARQSRRAGDSTRSPYDAPLGQDKMMTLVGSPGIGKSTMIKVLAKEMKLQVLTWNDAQVDYYDQSSREEGAVVPYQSQLASFEEFLVGCGTGIESLGVEMERKPEKRNDEYDGSLILIEEIPNLYNAESAQTFRNVIERHLQRTIVPTVLIFSDVYEGKHKPEDLERLIPKHMLYSLLVQTLQIQPVTKSKMKKCIEAIAKTEGLGRIPSEFIEELHLSSGGDIRHAIFALQFRYATKSNQCVSSNTTTNKRDVKLSSFHALGKLLYAKRRQRGQDSLPSTQSSTEFGVDKWDDGRGPLEFHPEEVLDQTDMNTGSAISFLSYHSPDFFTDITELSHAFDRLSDAGSFLDRFGASDGPYPIDYASSLGGRAIADANKNPAPSQFRHLTAPKVFDVMKKKRENEHQMDQLRKRLSVGSQKIAVNENIGSAHQFVTDSLPYLKNIISQDVNYALANLHSYAKEASSTLSQPKNQDDTQQEQQATLMDDDLVDDDNDDW